MQLRSLSYKRAFIYYGLDIKKSGPLDANFSLVPACENKLSFRRNEVTEKSLVSLKRFLPAVEMTDC